LQCSICKLISNIDNNVKIDYEKENEVWYGTEIHIGSATVNDNIKYYLETTSLISDFKWVISDEDFELYLEECDRIKLANIRERSGQDGWSGYKFNGNSYQCKHNELDSAFILRLGEENFRAQKENPKTVHCLFGVTFLGRKKAVQHFINHYPTILKKWGSEDYLLEASVNSDGEFIDPSNACSENLLKNIRR
jgi:hypothetical protein